MESWLGFVNGYNTSDLTFIVYNNYIVRVDLKPIDTIREKRRILESQL
jgi:hypothetical protein